MALSAVEIIDEVIEVSELLLTLLDTSGIEDESAKLALNNTADETSPETANFEFNRSKRKKYISVI